MCQQTVTKHNEKLSNIRGNSLNEETAAAISIASSISSIGIDDDDEWCGTPALPPTTISIPSSSIAINADVDVDVANRKKAMDTLRPPEEKAMEMATAGNFTVRLVEGKGLIRNHWNVLGLLANGFEDEGEGEGGLWGGLGLGGLGGKLRELTNAHGEVSPFVEFKLAFQRNCSSSSSFKSCSISRSNNSSRIIEEKEKMKRKTGMIFPPQEMKRSGVVRNNSNPRWSSPTSSSSSSSVINLPLPQEVSNDTNTNTYYSTSESESDYNNNDGMRIVLCLTVKEERTDAEEVLMDLPIPDIIKGGLMDLMHDDNVDDNNIHGSGNGMGGSSPKASTLGVGYADLTDLVLVEMGNSNIHKEDKNTHESSAVPHEPVLDTWIDLALPSSKNDEENDGDGKSAGRIRVIVSYQPEGPDPKEGDRVALLPYARRPSLTFPVLPTLLKVADARDDFLLVDYRLGSSTTTVSSSRKRRREGRMGRIRLHRRAVYVIQHHREEEDTAAVGARRKCAQVFVKGLNAARMVAEEGSAKVATVATAPLVLLGATLGGLRTASSSAAVPVSEDEDEDAYEERMALERRRRRISVRRSSGVVFRRLPPEPMSPVLGC
jgi:hypothetical protein